MNWVDGDSADAIEGEFPEALKTAVLRRCDLHSRSRFPQSDFPKKHRPRLGVVSQHGPAITAGEEVRELGYFAVFVLHQVSHIPKTGADFPLDRRRGRISRAAHPRSIE